MMKQVSIALATGLLIAGVWGAGAAACGSPNASPKISQPAGDTLYLTIRQQNTAWNDLRSHAAEQKAPSSFHAFVGSTVPSTVKIEQLPGKSSKRCSLAQALRLRDGQGQTSNRKPLRQEGR